MNQKLNHSSWITAILFWCGLVIVSSNYLTIPLMSIFMEAFEVSAARAAWTGSAFSIFYAAGSLLSGPLSDRYGRKQVMFYGLTILTVITIGLGFVQGLMPLIALRSIQGLAAASFAPVAIAYIVDKFPPQKIVTAIGFVSSSFLMSGIVGQIMSGYLSQQFGWQSVFYYFGGIYFLTAAVVLYLIPRTAIHDDKNNLMSMFKQFGIIISRKSLLQCYLITVTLLLSFVGMYMALGTYLSLEFKLSEQEILVVRAVGIIGMLFAPFAGKFSAAFGLRRVLQGGIALAAIGLAVLGFTTHLPSIIIMSVIFVMGIAITVPTLISLVGQLGGKDHSAAVSFYAFVLFIGTSLGPIVTTALLQTNSYVLTFETLALLLFVSLLVSYFIKVKDPVQDYRDE